MSKIEVLTSRLASLEYELRLLMLEPERNDILFLHKKAMVSIEIKRIEKLIKRASHKS